MNKQRVRLLASALAVITCLSIVFLGGRIALAQSSGTVTQLSAAYNSSAGKVQVSGSAVDLAKGIVVVEIHTPSGTLLYFGTTSADENGNFAVSVTVGTLKAGTYTVRSADYTGGAYKVATFTVTPVSYTHLDVYKRQASNLSSFLLYLTKGHNFLGKSFSSPFQML